MKKVNLDIVYASKNIEYKILLNYNMREPFPKILSVSDEYEYSNIRIKRSSNIIRTCTCAISRV